jgi:imidazolonepropionase-like amidohydrolase
MSTLLRTLPLILLAGCAGDESLDTWTGQGVLVIEGATVFMSPRVGPIQGGVVVIVDGVIEAVGVSGDLFVPPPDLWIDGSGLSVLSGFWNGHARVERDLLDAAASLGPEELQQMVQERFTRYGFTTVVDTESSPGGLAVLIDRIQSGEVMGPRIVSAPGGGQAPVHLPDPSSPVWSSELLARLAATDVALVPGLGFMIQAEDRGPESGLGVPPLTVEGGLSALRGFVDAGGRIVFGTGAGYLAAYDPMPEHLLLEEAGIPFAARLAALTTEPAARFGYDFVGAVEPGMVADLVLVEGDPEVDAMAFGRVRLVLREGRPLFW